MTDHMAEAVLEAIKGMLADGGFDAARIGLEIVAVPTGFVVSFDTPTDDPRIVAVARVAVSLNADEATELIAGGGYAPPELVGFDDDGPLVAVGGSLPPALGLEIENLIARARVAH